MTHGSALFMSRQASSKTGPPDTDTLHSHMMTGFQDVWKKFQSGLWVALPQHWVQGWVTANLQTLINDLGSGRGMTDDMALTLKAAIFLPPQAALQVDANERTLDDTENPEPVDADVVPTKDNAFLGR